MHVDAAALDVLRIEPGAVVEDDDALEDALRHIGARKRCAALVGDEHDVAIPDAACGGVIGLVQEGDLIEIDIPGRSIHLCVEDAELAERRKTWVCPEPKIKSGYLTRYAKLVSSADKGAILQ